MNKKKILFCWSDVSGYMAACWKALARSGEVDLHIIAFSRSHESSFNSELLQGLNFYSVSRDPAPEQVTSIANKLDPEVIVLCGWFVPAYKALAYDDRLKKRAKFILAMDTPWQGTVRQQIARAALRSFVGRMDAVLSSGERSFQYAKRLGAKQVFKFQYGVDTAHLLQASMKRNESTWPRRFLFAGRYVADKGLPDLVEAYAAYRSTVSDPWELHTYGQGPLKNILVDEGVVDHGFVQPSDMLSHWAACACMVLPSTFDPWPLIVVEACAAGLPVIVTHAAGSQVEVIKMYYNGIVINGGQVDELTSALVWIHKNHARLREMGDRSLEQAKPYGAEPWAEKMIDLIEYLHC